MLRLPKISGLSIVPHNTEFVLLMMKAVCAQIFETRGTTKQTELRNARNYETYGSSKRTELYKGMYLLQSLYIIIYTSGIYCIIHPLSEGLVTPPLGVEKLSPRLSFFDNMFSCIT